MKCPHGCENDAEFDDGIDLLDYSACDCCGTLMHHDSIGMGYFVMKDGRTLCSVCVETEDPRDIDFGDKN